MFFDAGDAWGEWSAQTVKELVPHGLAKYSDVWKAPLPDYSINNDNASVAHQSGYYIVSGVLGATVTYIVMLFISKLIVRNGE
jgi:hypothetical protein